MSARAASVHPEGAARLEFTLDLAAMDLAAGPADGPDRVNGRAHAFDVGGGRSHGAVFYKRSDGPRGATLELSAIEVDIWRGTISAYLSTTSQFSEIFGLSDFERQPDLSFSANLIATDALEDALSGLFATRDIQLPRSVFGRAAFAPSVAMSTVPVPASISLMLLGLVALFLVRRRIIL